MSRGLQHRTWGQKPEALALKAKMEAAHFFHADLSGGSGLTYQSCRFCQRGAHDSVSAHDPACWFIKIRRRCAGLWKYAIRHYACSECRADILLGIEPKR